MRVLLGPPGSGKTTRVLEEFAAAARTENVRLVVPTATMAEHLRHELARQGRHVPPSWINTLAGLLHGLLPEVRVASAPELALITGLALEAHPRLFPSLRGSPGLPAALASAFEELSGAGVGALQLESLAGLGARPDPDLVAAYRAVEEWLEQGGLRLRAQALTAAARRAAGGSAPFAAVWLDGFFRFSPVEAEFVLALAKQARVTVTLPEWAGATPLVERFRRSGARAETLAACRPRPRTALIRATSREHEVEEVVLRLLEEHEAGRPWREMGVVLRNEEEYLGRFERALFRAGVPTRAYFGRSLRREPACLLVRRFVEAVRSGWDGEATLKLLRTPVAVTAEGLRADGVWARAVEALPFQGLERLERLAPVAARALAPLADWPDLKLTPKEWSARLGELARLLAPPPAGRALTEGEIEDCAMRAAAFREILSLAGAAAEWLPAERVPLMEFWPHVEAGIHEARVYTRDTRRDAVHLLDVEEARQWELPVVFVCGLVESEFPRRVQPDPVLPDSLRQALAQQGIGIRTSRDREAEEVFHFEVARTRATQRLYLSWPERNENGDEILRAFVLDQPEAEGAETFRARRFAVQPARAAVPAPPPALVSDDVLASLRQMHTKMQATAIEAFLQCPFQFFAARTLELEELPRLPAERLDALFEGILAHEILKEWHLRGGDIATICEEHWDRAMRSEGLAETHQALLAREAMKRNLQLYARHECSQSAGRVELERELRLTLLGVEIRGRADRVDFFDNGECLVFDFKYSSGGSASHRNKREEEGLAVQGGLYARALQEEGYSPQEVRVVSLKNEVKLYGAASPAAVDDRIQTASRAAEDALLRIFEGRIDVRPADPDLCRWCSFRDACRVQESAAALAATDEA